MKRMILRILGILVLLGGIALVVIATVNFFETARILRNPPRLFWLFFVGFPMIAIGGSLFFVSLRRAP